jgi:diketogulonate reductase-like aldo/keto reductase
MAKHGKLIDSSPMYGRSEQVIGDLTTELGIADNFFYATKVWTTGRQSGIDQMESSMKKMRRQTIDLMQVHNLLDWETHLETLRQWKKEGKIRYIGVTHYLASAHPQLEQLVKSEDIDFIQVNYSIRVRNAEKSLLDAALDNGVAVIVNQPFEEGAVFGAVRGKTLPPWASDYGISSWAQFFLKYILSHPAVTCVIPGTSDPKNLLDNLGAGVGPLPDEETRMRMADLIG